MITQRSIAVLCTSHLHPLEAKNVNEVSFLHNDWQNIIQISKETIDDCKEKSLVCLASVLSKLMEQGYDFVLFDADFGDKVDDFPQYDW